MSIDETLRKRLESRLKFLYGPRGGDCIQRLAELLGRYAPARRNSPGELWNHRDVVLITYGDQVRDGDRPPLESLNAFLQAQRISGLANVLHILPFFPYSSDDGFSVIDYRTVDPKLGSWDDVDLLRKSFELMFDLVLNHCSVENDCFEQYLAGNRRYAEFFHEVDPSADLSAVTRPRSTPLLTPFETAEGTRHVWTTFSADQVDLNFANPDVLLEMLDVLLFYVAHGARIIRLDAIAYLWKRIGTSCIHLEETHAIVKLIRDVLDAVAPGTILLTETNVPHRENVSYFGNGDEAHMVYQFSLAPLVLDAFLTGDAAPLCNWLAGLEQPRPGTTSLNFTASHDGIGVRPLEGLVSQQRLDRLVASVRAAGGLVSTKRNTDGSDTPYELNVTYFSALGGGKSLPVDVHVRKFLSSQALMLALKGIPAIYFHSLLGTANFTSGAEETGRARTINRRKYEAAELGTILADPASSQTKVLDGYRKMIGVRIEQPAFHPDGGQIVHDAGHPALIAFTRTSPDRLQRILVLCNCCEHGVPVDLSRFGQFRAATELLSSRVVHGNEYRLDAFGTAWLAAG